MIPTTADKDAYSCRGGLGRLRSKAHPGRPGLGRGGVVEAPLARFCGPLPRAAATLMAVAAAVLLAGCAAWDPISDPPPDPEVQPLEVVVNSHSNPGEPCLTNVDEVRAGDHAVFV